MSDHIFKPLVVRLDWIDRQGCDQTVECFEFVILKSKATNLSGANWSKVGRMRKQNCPLAFLPFVKGLKRAMSGISAKVRDDISEANCCGERESMRLCRNFSTTQKARENGFEWYPIRCPHKRNTSTYIRLSILQDTMTYTSWYHSPWCWQNTWCWLIRLEKEARGWVFKYLLLSAERSSVLCDDKMSCLSSCRWFCDQCLSTRSLFAQTANGMNLRSQQ